MKIPNWIKPVAMVLAVAPAIGGLLDYVGFDLMGTLTGLPLIGGFVALLSGISGAYVLYDYFKK